MPDAEMRSRCTVDTLRAFALGWMALLAACSTSPADNNTDGPPISMRRVSPALVSAPTPLSDQAPAGSSSVVSGGLAYVSMPPGTDSAGIEAVISSRRVSTPVQVAMTAGGFDPIGLEAAPGDTLQIRIRYASGSDTLGYAVVPAHSLLTVVRTVPPRRKTDVPLNAVVQVIFSEPIDSTSLVGAIHLRRGGVEVPGAVEAVVSAGTVLSGLFRPSQPLAPATEYVFEVSTSITSLTGEALSAPVVVTFTTGGAPPPPPPAPQSTYSVGGKVSGLVGRGLELYLDGLGRGETPAQRLGISGNGAYVFPARLSPHSNGHSVWIKQPNSPTQRCVAQNPYFTQTSSAHDISDVNIVCGEFLYVANSRANAISTYSIDANTGAIASVGPPVAGGLSPYAIAGTLDKKYLYVSNSGSNDVSAFTVDASNGTLTAVPGSRYAAGTSPSAVSALTEEIGTQRGNHNSRLSYLYVANAGSNNVSAAQIDQNTGVLTPSWPFSYATGTGPSALAIAEFFKPILYSANAGGRIDALFLDGTPILGSPFFSGVVSGANISSFALNYGAHFLYAASASGSAGAIVGFAIRPYDDGGPPNPDFGALTPLPIFHYALPFCNYIVADQNGTYLYAAAGTNLFGYIIDKQTGALSPLPGFPISVGASADAVTIDPTNQFLYVRSGSAGKVTGFNLNAATGALTPMPGSPFTVGKSADFFAVF